MFGAFNRPWRILLALAPLSAAGCWSSGGPEVVVYTALDAEFSEPVLRDFTVATGVHALPKFDTESTKTVGLTEAIITERARPRCDVFWNNEMMHTLRLADLGLLEAYQPPQAEEYPALYRSEDGLWHGFAARARVLIVNNKLVSESERPTSINDLTNSEWKDRVGIAKPLFGTTATHAACLFQVWGEENATVFFQGVKKNARIMASNKQVAVAVAAGQLAFGLTDTDDAIVEIEKGMDVSIVYPDQQSSGLGTLFIPNTLAIVKRCPHPAEARKLVDYLLTAAVEDKLAAGPSAQIPLHPAAKASERVQTPAKIKAMEADFQAAASGWKEVSKFLRDEFTTGR